MQEIPDVAPEEPVEKYAHGFLHLDAHGVVGRDLLEDAARVIAAAERVGQAERAGAILDQVAAAVREMDAELAPRGMARFLADRMWEPDSAKAAPARFHQAISQTAVREERRLMVREDGRGEDGMDFADNLDWMGDSFGEDVPAPKMPDAFRRRRVRPEHPPDGRGHHGPGQCRREGAGRTLQEENRLATRDEQKVLAKYVGWGGLANAFPEYSYLGYGGGYGWKWKNPMWTRVGEELQELLSEEEYRLAKKSTQWAH